MKAFCPNARRQHCPRFPCNPIVTDDSRGALRQWCAEVAARQPDVDRAFVGAVELDLVFHLKRPASRTKEPFPLGRNRGDFDKLARAVADAIQRNASYHGRLIWDDEQIVTAGIRLRYAHQVVGGDGYREGPGVLVSVTALEPQPLDLEDYRARAAQHRRP